MVVRALPPECDGHAVRVLVEAFLDYPTWRAVGAREPVRRGLTIRRYYRGQFAVARRWGGTILGGVERERLLGVVLAFDPDRYPPPWWSLMWFAPVLLAGPGEAARGLRALAAMDSGHPRAPHLFLHTVGTDPRHQRRGVGRALVEQVTARADAQGRPVYLMTSRPELIDYYRSFGFNPVGEAPLPRGVVAYGMLREPPSKD